MKTKSPRKSAEERREQAAQLHERLTQQVSALAESDQWKRFLGFSGSFHRYSLNNLLLILAQHPTATRVAGFQQWKKLGRQVAKGQKAIKIFGYSTKKTTEEDPQTGEEKTKVRAFYPVLSVFDIDQTELMEGYTDNSSIAHLLKGEDEAQIFDRVATHMRGLGWTVERGNTAPANGYTTLNGTRRIVVSDTLAPAAAAKTMLHEAAHALLHAEDGSEEYAAHRGVKETEAESVAYVMAGMLGLDTAAYSVGYVAGWANADVELIRSTAGNVLRAVHILSDALLEEQIVAELATELAPIAAVA